MKVEDTMPSCTTNLLSVKKDGIYCQPPTWEDFSDVHFIFRVNNK